MSANILRNGSWLYAVSQQFRSSPGGSYSFSLISTQPPPWICMTTLLRNDDSARDVPSLFPGKNLECLRFFKGERGLAALSFRPRASDDILRHRPGNLSTAGSDHEQVCPECRTSYHRGPFSVIPINVSFNCFSAWLTASGLSLDELTTRSL